MRYLAGTGILHLHGPGLHLLLGGRGTALQGDDRVALPKDSLLLLPNSASLMLEAEGRGVLLSIDLPDEQALKSFSAPFLLVPLSAHPTGSWAASFAPALKSSEDVAAPAARDLIAGAVQRVAELAEHCLAGFDGINAVRARTRASRLARVEAARIYLEQRLHRRVNLAEVAHVIGLSKFHLHRAFVDVWGVGPGAFHARARLERAGQMIASGTSPAQVARALGYATQASFHRAFVRQFGYKPTEAARSGR